MTARKVPKYTTPGTPLPEEAMQITNPAMIQAKNPRIKGDL